MGSLIGELRTFTKKLANVREQGSEETELRKQRRRVYIHPILEALADNTSP